MIDTFIQLFQLPEGGTEWTVHISIFLLNIILLIFSRKIVTYLNPQAGSGHVSLFRALNVTFLIFHILDILLGNVNEAYNNIFIKLAMTIVSTYMTIMLYTLSSFFSRKKFGATKNLDGREIRIDTYSSRLVDIFLAIIIVGIGFYALIKIWNMDSMLETTGLYGILIGFFALTNQIWAPDVFYGMVILYSKLLEDGDVIQFDGEEGEYIINKVNFIYTVLLDIRSNHRALIKNSQLIAKRIDNLSKKASADGLRYTLKYKIGYPKSCQNDRQERETSYQYFRERIDAMFRAVQDQILKKNDVIKVNALIPFEWTMTNAGDYALEFTLFYHLETLPNTKVTRTIRKYIVASRNALNEEVFKQSHYYGIDLSTPILHQVAE